MQLSNTPSKLVRPFADAGGRNAIPEASQIGVTAGAASLTDGFPPLTRTPVAAGGVPPSGLDMNGILYEMSAAIRWANAGGGYAFDGTFAADTNVGGYPKGARVMRSDGQGYWFNTVDGNEVDPETSGAAAAGWVPDFQAGAAAVVMASASVTLTPAQYGKPLIVITGTLTANLNLVFPAIATKWMVINAANGSYTLTAKTPDGSGVALYGGFVGHIVGDGANIYSNEADLQTSRRLSICKYGASPYNAASQNDAAIARAIAALGDNQQLWIPPIGTFDCTTLNFTGKSNFGVCIDGKLSNQSSKPGAVGEDSRGSQSGAAPTIKVSNCSRFHVYGDGVIENRYREAIWLETCFQFNITCDCIGSGINDNLPGVYVRYCHDFRISGMRADGVTLKPASGYAVQSNAFQIWDSYRFTVANCEICNNGMNGVYVALNCYDFQINDGNRIHNNAASGIQLAWTGTNADKFPYRFSICDNIIANNRADAIDCNNTHPLGIQDAWGVISNNLLSENGWVNEGMASATPTADGAGVTLIALYNIIVSGNQITEPSRAGVYLNGVQDFVVTGNNIYKSAEGNVAECIYIQTVARGTVTANRLYSALGDAVKTYTTSTISDLQICGNAIKGRFTNAAAGPLLYIGVFAANNSILCDTGILAYFNFENNSITTTADAINSITLADGICIKGNRITSQGAGGKAIVINGTNYATVDSNYAVSAGSSGIWVSGAIAPVLTNNYGEGKDAASIYLNGTSNAVLTGNRAKQTGQANAFRVESTCTGTIKFSNTSIAGLDSFSGTYSINY